MEDQDLLRIFGLDPWSLHKKANPYIGGTPMGDPGYSPLHPTSPFPQPAMDERTKLIELLGVGAETPEYEPERPGLAGSILAGLADVLYAKGRGINMPATMGYQQRLAQGVEQRGREQYETKRDKAQAEYQAKMRQIQARLQALGQDRSRAEQQEALGLEKEAEKAKAAERAADRQADQEFDLRKIQLEHQLKMDELDRQARLRPREKSEPIDRKGRESYSDVLAALRAHSGGLVEMDASGDPVIDPATGKAVRAPSWKQRIKDGLAAGKDIEQIKGEILEEFVNIEEDSLALAPEYEEQIGQSFKRRFEREAAAAKAELDAEAPDQTPARRPRASLGQRIGSIFRIPGADELLNERSEMFGMTPEEFEAKIGRR